jgi:opacity protein-like surface antigen
MHNRSRAIAISLAILLTLAIPLGAESQKKISYAGVGFMALSPNFTDTLASYSIADTLYGGTVSFAVSPWFTVGADVLYLGDIYYGKDANGFFGPVSWTKLNQKASTPPATKADAYYESLIYAPLTFNLTLPLGFVVPYIGAGPAFFFHFPSTNTDQDFSAYLGSHYGDAQRIRSGLTARAGLDIFIADGLALGVGYTLREDTPANIFTHLADKSFYLENGYIFITARAILR